MRIAFAGSPAAALPPLRALAASDHEVTMVVTQPDRPVGRSGRARPTPVGAAAEELGLRVLRPPTINADDVIGRIADSGAEALCVVAFGQILRAGVLDRWPCLNVHFSLLPAYRGAAPVERALMDGAARTGVTIMEMDPGMDTGPIVATAAVDVGPEETGGALTERLAELGAPMLVAAVDDLAAGRLRSVPQPEEGVSYAPKIVADDRILDPAEPARRLADRVRALAPHIGATCVIDGLPFKVWVARPLERPAPAGLAVEEGARLVMGTAEGGLELLEVQPAGKTRMPAATFLRGYRGALELGEGRVMAEGGVSEGRAVALRVLRRVDGGAYADRALDGEARRAGLGPRERAQATRLSYGAVQRRRTLDWLIDEALDRPAGLEAPLRDILRLGAYEIAFSEGVPDRAAVDQAVRQARALRGSGARAAARAGLVNAVLRRVAAEAPERLARLGGDSPEELALRHSMPDWIARRLVAALGEEAAGVMAAASEPAESAVRWNPLRGPRATLEAELPAGWRRDALVPEAYVLSAPFALQDSRAWARGLVMGQSRASMLPARVLAPERGERVLDLCAAPGAKSTHLAALSRNGADVTSVELRPARAEALRALARRMGARLTVVEGDARTVALDGRFDAALVDPPCTGLGVLASRPDARWRRREDALAPLVELQRDMLARALAAVRPGGRVVYSTCTLLREENEDVVAASGAAREDLSGRFPEIAHPDLPGALRTLPHRHGTDGFFIAMLRP